MAGDPRHVASNIKQAVRDAGLSCSICVAPNKLLAKIGSELDKPDGLTLLMHADVPVRIWQLSVRKVNRIGPKATERLAALGMATVGIKLLFADFQTVTRDLTLPAPTADAGAIRRAAGAYLKRVTLNQRLRLLGVRVGRRASNAKRGPATGRG